MPGVLDGAADTARDASPDAPGVVDRGSLVGTVVHVSGVPVPAVRVRVGDAITVTDAEGHFVLAGLPIPQGPVVATFERRRYGRFARRIQLRPDNVVFTHVVLKDSGVPSRKDPVAGFMLDKSDVRVTFPPNTLRDTEGNAIDEPVDIAVVTGDPTNIAEAPLMPGDYFSDEGGGTPLDSVAFLDLTATGVTGIKVRDIDPAAPLIVELPIPAALQGDYAAGGTIPWWSFDETLGSWRREGDATVFDNGGTLWARGQATPRSSTTAARCGRAARRRT